MGVAADKFKETMLAFNAKSSAEKTETTTSVDRSHIFDNDTTFTSNSLDADIDFSQ
jgi:hypothetical protein